MAKQNVNYPFQVASIIQQKNGEFKTLGIDALLSTPNSNDESEKNMPLEMHSGFSRFKVTLIKKSDASIFLWGNIPADDVAYIYKKTKDAMSVLTNGKVAKSTGEKLSPAYIERFGMGTFKGKTPAELLLENPNNKAELIKQGEFLNKNADKYPANKKMIAAIKDAINLFKEEKLVDKKIDTPTSILEIYNEPMKPLRSKKNEKGLNMVYGIKIVCDTSKNLPFSIEIMNCYAPLEVTSSGTLNPKMKEAENIDKISMNLSEKDWFTTINRMNKTLSNFEAINFQKQLKIANDSYFSNAKEAKEEK